jgi:choline kinase
MGSTKGNVKVAVIMCAGQGKRLRPITDTRPKSMIEVGGKPLLARHLEHLAAWGASEIVLVVGFCRGEIDKLVARGAPRGATLTVLENADYEKSGSGYSLAIALRDLEKRKVGGDVLFMDADLLYPRDLMRPLVEPASVGNAVLVGHGKEDDEEAVKVRGPQGRVVELNKKNKRKDLPFHGESVGIARISPAGRATLLEWMSEREKTTRDYEWEHVLEGSADKLELRSIKCPDLPWTEIDTVEDLRKAEGLLPRIE